MRGHDGRMHVYAKQADIPLPKRFAHCRLAPIQSRVLPSKKKFVHLFVEALKRFKHDLWSPYATAATNESSLEQGFAESIVQSINFDDLQSRFLTHEFASYIRSQYGDAFIEELDKDSSQFVVACPRFIMQVVHVAAEFIHCDDIIEGFSYTVSKPFSARALSLDGIPNYCVDILAGSVVGDLFIRGDVATFVIEGQTLSAPVSVLTTCAKRRAGSYYDYSIDGAHWPDLEHLHVEGLKPNLQPTSVNGRFAQVWRKQLGSRPTCVSKLRFLPKVKGPLKMRPLADQSTWPYSLVFRIIARYIDLTLSQFCGIHCDKPSHSKFLEYLREVRSQISQAATQEAGLSFTISSFDVDNGFMRIVHAEVCMAWDLFASMLADVGLDVAYVSPRKSRICGPSGPRPHAT